MVPVTHCWSCQKVKLDARNWPEQLRESRIAICRFCWSSIPIAQSAYLFLDLQKQLHEIECRDRLVRVEIEVRRAQLEHIERCNRDLDEGEEWKRGGDD